MLEYPPDATKGDIALPCFKLSRALRRPPVQIAATLAGALKAGEPGSPVASVEAVNGYLNFKISDEYLANRVLPEVLERREKYGAPRGYEGMKIVLDYSSPNVAKPFHIGHLGTTVIGHSLRRLFEFAGCRCYSINHLGDWDTIRQADCRLSALGSREEVEERKSTAGGLYVNSTNRPKRPRGLRTWRGGVPQT